MKNAQAAAFITLFILLVYSPLAISQTKFTINDYATLSNYASITQESADKIFNEIKKAPIIEYRYTRGGCDYRAHAIYLMLKKKNIPTFKIWNFASAKIFIAGQNFNKHNLLLRVSDKINLSTKLPYYRNCSAKIEDYVYWGYHVASVVLVKKSNKVDTLVIDPALYDKPTNYKTWVKSQLQQNASSYFTFLDGKYISFQTESQYKRNDIKCNDCSGNDIITGVFWDDTQSISQKWIEESISKGKIFVEYYKAEIEPKEKELMKYDIATTDPKALNLACIIAEMKNNISDESGISKLPDEYQKKLVKYKEEATQFLFK